MRQTHGWRGDLALIPQCNIAHIALRQDRERPAAMTPRWTRMKDGPRPMSAPLAKNDLVFKLATSQSYIDQSYDDHSYNPTPYTRAQPAPRGLLRQLEIG